MKDWNDESWKPAAERLRAFRSTWEAGDKIDEESGLTAADLDAILSRVDLASDMVAIRHIDFRSPPPDAPENS